MNTVDKYICNTQGNIYELMANSRYEMNTFSKEFMKSDFCRTHFDTTYSPYQTEPVCVLKDMFLRDIKKQLKRKPCISDNDRRQARAIGYIYRQIYMETCISSAELADIVPYEEIMNRLENDVDWFEPNHRGEVGVFEDIMTEHNLPRKRYDEGHSYMTLVEFEMLNRKAEEERQELMKSTK